MSDEEDDDAVDFSEQEPEVPGSYVTCPRSFREQPATLGFNVGSLSLHGWVLLTPMHPAVLASVAPDRPALPQSTRRQRRQVTHTEVRLQKALSPF